MKYISWMWYPYILVIYNMNNYSWNHLSSYIVVNRFGHRITFLCGRNKVSVINEEVLITLFQSLPRPTDYFHINSFSCQKCPKHTVISQINCSNLKYLGIILIKPVKCWRTIVTFLASHLLIQWKQTALTVFPTRTGLLKIPLVTHNLVFFATSH